ncbi:hypothetical protein B0H13DRAFT_2307197 [Mycena leptocephala]|nr:hypothetical protein B0H13DRAFT_2307197 [Mycena leptocephala]
MASFSQCVPASHSPTPRMYDVFRGVEREAIHEVRSVGKWDVQPADARRPISRWCCNALGMPTSSRAITIDMFRIPATSTTSRSTTGHQRKICASVTEGQFERFVVHPINHPLQKQYSAGESSPTRKNSQDVILDGEAR